MIDEVRIVDEVRSALTELFDEPERAWTRGVNTLKHPLIRLFSLRKECGNAGTNPLYATKH